MIGGVASGLAAYFNIEIWIPRVLFCLPLILGIIRSIFRHAWFDFDGPFTFISNGLGGGLTTLYIILWIVLPEAKTASEKLEMRGEKIDLESIKNTIKSDLEGFKQKATVVGGEIKQRAEEFGNEMKNKSGGIRKDISSVNVPRNGIGHAIGVLFKAFFLFISVIVTFALVMALIGLIFTGAGVLPLKDYFIQGFWQNLMAWSCADPFSDFARGWFTYMADPAHHWCEKRKQLPGLYLWQSLGNRTDLPDHSGCNHQLAFQNT